MGDKSKSTIRPQIIDGFKIEIDSDDVMCSEYKMDTKHLDVHDDKFLTSKLNTDKFVIDLNESIMPITMDRIKAGMYTKADIMNTNGTDLFNVLTDSNHKTNDLCQLSGKKTIDHTPRRLNGVEQSTYSMSNTALLKSYPKDHYITPINCTVLYDGLNRVPEYIWTDQSAPLDLSIPKSRDGISPPMAAHRTSSTVTVQCTPADVQVFRQPNQLMLDDKEMLESDSNESRIQKHMNLLHSANKIYNNERHVVHRPTPMYPKLFHSYCLYRGENQSNYGNNSNRYTITKKWGCCGKHLWANPLTDSRLPTCDWEKIKVNILVDPVNQQSTYNLKDQLAHSDYSDRLSLFNSLAKSGCSNYTLPPNTDRNYHQMIDTAPKRSFGSDIEDAQHIQQYFNVKQNLARFTDIKWDTATRENVDVVGLHKTVPNVKQNKHVPGLMSSNQNVNPDNLTEVKQCKDRNRRKSRRARNSLINTIIHLNESEKGKINEQHVTNVCQKDLGNDSDDPESGHEYLTRLHPKQKRRKKANPIPDIPLMETKDHPSLNEKVSSNKQYTSHHTFHDSNRLFMGRNTKDAISDDHNNQYHMETLTSSDIAENQKDKNVKLGASFVCATCKFKCNSLFTLLEHQSKEYHPRKANHAVDCLGKSENNECQCTNCQYCLNVFNSKFRVFSHCQGRCLVKKTYFTNIGEGHMLQDSPEDQENHSSYGQDDNLISVSAGCRIDKDRTALRQIKLKHHEDDVIKSPESLSKTVSYNLSKSLTEIVPFSHQPSESLTDKAPASILMSGKNRTEFKSPWQKEMMFHNYKQQVTSSGDVFDGVTAAGGIPVCDKINAEIPKKLALDPILGINFYTDLKSPDKEKSCIQIKNVFHDSSLYAKQEVCQDYESPSKQSTSETSQNNSSNSPVLVKCNKKQSPHSQTDKHVTDRDTMVNICEVKERKPIIKMEVGDINVEVAENSAQISNMYRVPQQEVENKSTYNSKNPALTNSLSRKEKVLQDVTNKNTAVFKVPTKPNIFKQNENIIQLGVKTTTNPTIQATPVKLGSNNMYTSTVIKTESVTTNVSERKDLCKHVPEYDCPLELTCLSFHNHDDNNRESGQDVASGIIEGKAISPNDSDTDIRESYNFVQHDPEIQHRSSKIFNRKYKTRKDDSLLLLNASPLKKSAIAFGACENINKNGEKEKITYLLDANSTPIMLVEKEQKENSIMKCDKCLQCFPTFLFLTWHVKYTCPFSVKTIRGRRPKS